DEIVSDRSGVAGVDGADALGGVQIVDQQRAVQDHADQVPKLEVVDHPGAAPSLREMTKLLLEDGGLEASQTFRSFRRHHQDLPPSMKYAHPAAFLQENSQQKAGAPVRALPGALATRPV